jgi:hypothetical protein
MKKIYLNIFIFLSINSTKVFAQDCFWSPYFSFGIGNQLIDTNSFESTNGLCKILIDSTMPNNIWQIGSVTKPAFDTTHSGWKAMQTDTINSYPINDTSAFVLYIDSSFEAANYGYSISFWHKLETDTLKDWCIFQATSDAGLTWQTVGDTNSKLMGYIQYNGSLNNYVPNYLNKPLIWSGNYSNWQQEEICITFFVIKNMTIPKDIGFRFLFVSDSIYTNKAGWIIDDIRVNSPKIVGSVGNINSKFKISPNPVVNKQLYLDYSNEMEGNFELFDISGRQIFNVPLSNRISLPTSITGLYFYTIQLKNNKESANGKLIIE